MLVGVMGISAWFARDCTDYLARNTAFTEEFHAELSLYADELVTLSPKRPYLAIKKDSRQLLIWGLRFVNEGLKMDRGLCVSGCRYMGYISTISPSFWGFSRQEAEGLEHTGLWKRFGVCSADLAQVRVNLQVHNIVLNLCTAFVAYGLYGMQFYLMKVLEAFASCAFE